MIIIKCFSRMPILIITPFQLMVPGTGLTLILQDQIPGRKVFLKAMENMPEAIL